MLVPEPQSRRLPLGTGLTYHVLTWDPGPAVDHTVILLHGFLDFARGMAPLVDAGLGAKFHVVVPDLRGHGDSDRVGAGGYYHFADYFADLDELVRLVGRARVSLVGHSMGGSVAAYFTGAFPERVHRLALLEGTGPPEGGPVGGPERVAAWLAAWRKVREAPPRAVASVDEAAARLRKHDPLVDPALARRLAEEGTDALPDGTRRFKHDPLHLTSGPYSGFQFELARRFWSRITCPTLLVEGSESTMRHTPDEAARRAACFGGGARQVTIAGAGHMMQRHQPVELARLLVEFLEA